MSRHVVAAADELQPGEKKLVTIKGREIGVFNVGGEFFALANRCPHAGGPMCEGRVVGLVLSSRPGQYSISRKGEFLRCPWHGWEFDIRTGQSWCDPKDLKIRQFKTAVTAGAELVKGPYVAETFAVKVEENYVVVDV
jgi:nitrite reductase/ring-hydroxylating ferredoxin subunit